MKLLDCPHLGPRPQNEFTYAGELRHQPDPDTCNDGEWANYVFNRQGQPGIHWEWWYHNPSGMWFLAQRDTVSDNFIDIRLADHTLVNEVSHA